jgi:hypothetical protein
VVAAAANSDSRLATTLTLLSRRCSALTTARLILPLILPSPWNVIVFAVTFVLGIGEIAYWHRTVKGPTRAGSETRSGQRRRNLGLPAGWADQD